MGGQTGAIDCLVMCGSQVYLGIGENSLSKHVHACKHLESVGILHARVVASRRDPE